MIDPKTALLSRLLARVLADLDSGGSPQLVWARARDALARTAPTDDELARAVEARDAPALRDIVAGWHDGSRPLCEQDKAVLKRAMKAFRKRLKLTRLDAESTISGSATSSGRKSGIVAITPPTQYPREVWDELVRLGRLRDAGHGMLEPPE